MKKVVLTLVSAIALLSSFSQVKDTSLTENYINGSWQLTSRSIFTFNASCNITNVITQNWDSFASSWVNAYQSNHGYSTGPDKTIIINQSWNPGTNSWDNTAKSSQTYSADHSQLISINQTWDAVSQAWLNLYKVKTTFNTSGNTILDEFDMFADNQWQPGTRTSLEYNNTERPATIISQVWNGSAWANSSKRTNSYDGKGESLGFYWSDFDQQWVKSDRNFNDYVDNTLYTEKSLSQFLNGNIWVNSARTANSYTSDLKQIGSSLEIWDAGSSSWSKIYRGKQDYYANGQPSVYVLQLWDASSAAWVPGNRFTQTNHTCPVELHFSPAVAKGSDNNATVLSSVRAMLGLDQKPVNNTAISFNHFESGSDAMVYDVNVAGKNNSGEYSFQIIQAIKKSATIANADASNAQQTNTGSLVISPNPAKSYFNININSRNPAMLTLHDLSGRLVLQQKMQPAGVQKVNLPSLQKGVYIVTVTTGKEILKQKLVIE